MADIFDCSCTGSEELKAVIKEITPIVGYMMNVVIMIDDEKVKIFVGTKTAKTDVEMLLPEKHMDKISVEIVSDEKYG